MSDEIEKPDWDLLIPDQVTTEIRDGQVVETVTDNSAIRREAAEQFDLIASQIDDRGDLVSALDHMILRLVMARIRWRRAIQMVMRLGAVVVSRKTGGLVTSRWNSVAREAGEEARKLEKDLGLSGRPPNRAGKPRRVKLRLVSRADRYLNRQGEDK